MIVTSQNLVLSTSSSQSIIAVDADLPLIGWHNLVTRENLDSTYEDEAFPLTNLATPSTIEYWQSTSLDVQYISLSIVDSDDPVDYVAIARHNFGSHPTSVSVEVNAGEEWITVVEETIPPDDTPIIFRFAPTTSVGVRLRLSPTSDVPRVAVMYVGKLLVMERKVYVGHTPLPMARSSEVVTGMSEGGDFLGRIVLSQSLATQVDFQNLHASWYRDVMEPFVQSVDEYPFFFSWRPYSYAREVGFAWAKVVPQPKNQRSNGMMSISLSMGGIVK